jgi:hypothetical protein
MMSANPGAWPWLRQRAGDPRCRRVESENAIGDFRNGAVRRLLVECRQLICTRGDDGIHRVISGRNHCDAVAWRGPRSLALTLFAVTLIASIATYLHHATDTLKLSF